MNTLAHLHAVEDDPRRVKFAQWLRSAIEANRWSVNKAAAKIGMSKSTLASRFRGETPFLADELAPLAGLAGIDAVRLYRIFIGEEDMPVIDVKRVHSGRVTDIREWASRRAATA